MRIVCFCNSVYESEIKQSFNENGLMTTADIQEHTGAGTCCGKCLPVIDDLVKKLVRD